MRMFIFLLLLIAMYLVSCETNIIETHPQRDWKERSFKGKIGYEIPDTTVIYEKHHSTCPLVNQRLFKD